jgi:dTDP-4-amino-4,6-dideoxygalactose transaminase
MTEINALTGSFLMKSINKFIKWREKIAKIYHSNLSKIPGISFQKISNKSKTVNTFFPILINPSEFGIDRNLLEEALRYENIETRKYFYPPVHLQDCYKNLRNEKLPNTDTISSRIICLPIHNLIEKKTIKKICEVMHRIHNHSSDIKKLKVKK